jgi:ubiquitin C-terminal hydrolase
VSRLGLFEGCYIMWWCRLGGSLVLRPVVTKGGLLAVDILRYRLMVMKVRASVALAVLLHVCVMQVTERLLKLPPSPSHVEALVKIIHIGTTFQPTADYLPISVFEVSASSTLQHVASEVRKRAEAESDSKVMLLDLESARWRLLNDAEEGTVEDVGIEKRGTMVVALSPSEYAQYIAPKPRASSSSFTAAGGAATVASEAAASSTQRSLAGEVATRVAKALNIRGWNGSLADDDDDEEEQGGGWLSSSRSWMTLSSYRHRGDQSEKLREVAATKEGRQFLEEFARQVAVRITRLPRQPHVGIVGFVNLGNTCFMNSALQCLLSVEPLTRYFLMQRHILEVNKENPLGQGGRLACTYANLIRDVWSSSGLHSARTVQDALDSVRGESVPPDHSPLVASARGAVAPSTLKAVVARAAPQFAGYGQQDSQEFLSFLLDGIHEDLNRVLNKPATEVPVGDNTVDDRVLAKRAWDVYLKRNRSVVVDLFQGQLRSELKCPACANVSVTFDPYMYLGVPLPRPALPHDRVLLLSASSGRLPHIFPLPPLAQDTAEYLHPHISAAKTGGSLWALLATPQDRGSPMSSLTVFKAIATHVEEPVREEVVLCMPPSDLAVRRDARFPASPFVDVALEEMGSQSDGGNFFTAREAAARTAVPALPAWAYPPGDKTFEGFRHSVCSCWTEALRADASDESETVAPTDDLRVNCMGVLVEPPVKRFLLSAASNPTGLYRPQGFTSTIVALSRRPATTVVPPPLPSERDAPEPFVWVSARLTTPSDDGEPKPFGFPLLWFHKSVPSSGVQKRERSDEAAEEAGQKRVKAETGSFLGGWFAGSPAPASTPEDDATPTPPISVGVACSELHAHALRMLAPLLSPLVGARRPYSDAIKAGLAAWSSGETRPLPAGMELPFTLVVDSRFDWGGQSPALTPLDPSSSDPLSPPEPAPRPGSFYRTQLFRQPLRVWIVLRPELAAIAALSMFPALMRTDPPTVGPPCPGVQVDNVLFRAEQGHRKFLQTTLSDCLELFCSEEKLGQHDTWYCPKCKEHVQATKILKPWSAPPVLIIQLKRFTARSRINTKVSFPTEGLDLSSILGAHSEEPALSPTAAAPASPSSTPPPLYDLFAVSEHHGSLGGGHYTAQVKGIADPQWYVCDDSAVTPVGDAGSSLVTSAAYLLFYRRRGSRLDAPAPSS